VNVDKFLLFNIFSSFFGFGEEVSHWSPRMDIKETDKNYVINVEVPGVKKEDIKIRIKGDFLEIEGEMKKTTENKDEKYHRIERQSGKYFRRIQIPEDVNRDSIAAKYEDGILGILLMRNMRMV